MTTIIIQNEAILTPTPASRPASVRTTPQATTDPSSPSFTVQTETVTDAPAADTGMWALVSLWPRFVLFVVGMFIILGTIESYLALVDKDGPKAHAFRARLASPYVEFYSEPDFHSQGIVTNNAGFRYGPLPRDKPENEVRVFFLSSSVGFRGESNETTIAGYMERQLAARTTDGGRRVRVVNASGTSFTSTQSLVLLVTKILKYEPDVLVVFHGPETLFYPSIYDKRPGYPFNFRVRERIQNKTASASDGVNPLVAMLKQFRMTQLLHPNLGRNERQAALAKHNYLKTFHSLDEYDPYIDVVAEDIGKISQIASAYGCRTMVAIPPWQSAALLPGAIERLADRVADEVAVYRNDSMRYVDTQSLTKELKTRRLWQADGVHWNDEGNRLVASCLVEALLDSGWIGRAP